MGEICYVDESLIFLASNEDTTHFNTYLDKNFILKDPGHPIYYLRIRLLWIDDRPVILCQKNLIDRLRSARGLEHRNLTGNKKIRLKSLVRLRTCLTRI